MSRDAKVADFLSHVSSLRCVVSGNGTQLCVSYEFHLIVLIGGGGLTVADIDSLLE